MADALSQASRLSIEELTGSLRQIALLGRALPYQGVAFGGTEVHKITWYPGNPEGTLQVLGPSLEPTTFHGFWKDRFLPGQIEQVGFAELIADSAGDVGAVTTVRSAATAERLVRAFESLRASGQRLRVQWGSIVREGILSSFTPKWVRLQDCEWEMEFVWFSAGVSAPRAASTPPESRTEMRTAMDANDGALRRAPRGRVNGSYQAELRASTRLERVQIAQMFGALASISSASPAGGVPLGPLNALSTASDAIRLVAQDTVERLSDQPYLVATEFDAVTDVLRIEAWRRSLGRTQAELMATALRVAGRERERRQPANVTIVLVPGDTTLRALAQRYYGTSDSWQLIANANGLTDSMVRAGTTIVIPPPAAS